MLKNVRFAILVAMIAEFMAVSTLHAQWADNGIPLGAAGGGQESPVITYDGTGGAVIVWMDTRNPVNADIYAQAVTASGAVRWFPNAMPVCTAGDFQSNPLVVPDGAGGTIIAWADPRGARTDIYVQKLSEIGFVQWESNGVVICTGQNNVTLGEMVSDGAGGAIITWHDRRDFSNGVFAQRISSNGTAMWTANGVTVCSIAEHQQNPAIVSDGSGGAIIAWEDRRNGEYDIYGQRLNASGVAQWTADGVGLVVTSQDQTSPQLVEDGAGGAVIAFLDRRNTIDFDIFAQRVDASGAAQWGTGVPAGAWMGDQTDCRLIHIGSGETIVTWVDERNGASNTDVYAQKLNASGAGQWGFSGAAICTATGNQDNASIVPNGAGGALVSWDDERNGATNSDVYAQSIDFGGTPSWTADGKAICGATGDQRTAVISQDGTNGMFVAWGDSRSGSVKAYSHRVDAAGDIPTPTLIHNYDAQAIGTGIRIDWTLSEIDDGVEFQIFRAEGQGMQFVEIPAVDLVEDGLAFSFVDRNCQPGITYYYRVAFDLGSEGITLFETGPVTRAVTVLELHQNLPNPFNPSTDIAYYVPKQSQVQLQVFDVRGSEVAVLVDESQTEGTYRARWNGRYANGSEAASGVYFYRLRAGNKMLSRRMILLR